MSFLACCLCSSVCLSVEIKINSDLGYLYVLPTSPFQCAHVLKWCVLGLILVTVGIYV